MDLALMESTRAEYRCEAVPKTVRTDAPHGASVSHLNASAADVLKTAR